MKNKIYIKKISIIGLGNLSQALIAGLDTVGYKGLIHIYDIDKKKKKYIKSKNMKFKTNIDESIIGSTIILIAIKPNNLKNVATKLKNLNINSIIVSLMAGVKISQITRLTNKDLKIARIMTNINARHESAMSFVYMNKKCTKIEDGVISELFEKFGSLYYATSENQLNKITALIGSGPAYFIHFAESIMKTFKSFGFTEAESMKYSLELFYTTAYSCIVDDRTLGLIKKSIISKNGTTEAALKKMNQRNFQKNIKDSILAAYKKSQELSREE